jgi:hypothetical protein
MTLWEFSCAVDGFNAANGAKETAPAMSDERMADLGIEGF